MVISIASGKGGTGKTTIATSLAKVIQHTQIIDCDVEEPNAHIFLKPVIKNKEKVKVLIPQVDYQLCNFCGKCARFCQFNALAVFEEKVLIFPELCHNCGGCQIVCPQKAISECEIVIGQIEKGIAHHINFLHGILDISRPSPVPLIKKLKTYISPQSTVIIDSPPGTSCSMIESIEASDYCILVTEPTPFGLNDLKLAVTVVKKMKIKHGVIINQSDIGDDKVKKFCRKHHIDILMEIPHQREIAEAYSRGDCLVSAFPEYESKFKQVFSKIQKLCLKKKTGGKN